jgi:hypothetical protein
MNYITLYPHIKFTTGVRGTLLFDYVTDKIIKLTKSQSEILLHINKSIEELKQIHNPEEVSDLMEFIKENGIGRKSEIKFPKIYTPSERPFKIDICELEINEYNVNKFKIYFNKLLDHGCSTFVFLFNSVESFKSSLNIIKQIPLSINIKFYRALPPNDLTILSEIIHSENIYFVHVANYYPANDFEYSKKIIWMTDSKKIAPYLEVYDQSLYGHPYFFGRIFIDPNGMYSNGYRNKVFLGDLNDETISIAIANLISNGNWLTKRENIIQCRNCEFRDICLDDSQLEKINGELYSLMEKCDYEPEV